MVDTTAGKLLVAIIFSQAPHFSFVQSDVLVDPEVVQPVVIAFWVDLERRVCVSKRSPWARGKSGFEVNGPGLESGPTLLFYGPWCSSLLAWFVE